MLLKLLMCVTVCVNVGAQMYSDNPCDVHLHPEPRRVPAMCTNGTFYWPYPREEVELIIPNPDQGSMSVCIKQRYNFDNFTVTDVSYQPDAPIMKSKVLVETKDPFGLSDKGKGFLCTPEYTPNTEIVLQFGAPKTKYYVEAWTYYINTRVVPK